MAFSSSMTYDSPPLEKKKKILSTFSRVDYLEICGKGGATAECREKPFKEERSAWTINPKVPALGSRTGMSGKKKAAS